VPDEGAAGYMIFEQTLIVFLPERGGKALNNLIIEKQQVETVLITINIPVTFISSAHNIEVNSR